MRRKGLRDVIGLGRRRRPGRQRGTIGDVETLAGKLRLAVAVVGLLLLGWGLWPLPRHTYTTDLGGMRLTFSVPTALRAGDSAPARLEVFADPASAADAERVPQVAVRLTFNGASVSPPGEVSLTWGPRAPTRFTWHLEGPMPGRYVGSLWVYQVFPDGSRMARLTYPLHLRVSAFLGLRAPQVRLLGWFALLVGGFLVLAYR